MHKPRRWPRRRLPRFRDPWRRQPFQRDTPTNYHPEHKNSGTNVNAYKRQCVNDRESSTDFHESAESDSVVQATVHDVAVQDGRVGRDS